MADLSASAQGNARLGPLPLDNGATLPECLIGFRTFGTLNDSKANVLVFPSWYGGRTDSMVDYELVGSGCLADSDNFFVIAIDSLANGISSSPSQMSGENFPAVTIRDMVRAQHLLLTKHFELDHVHAILGVSMSGMHAYQWSASYPDFASNIIAIIGTPKPCAADLYLWQFWRELANEALQLPDGERRALELLAVAEDLFSFTPEFINAVSEDGSPDARLAEVIADMSASNARDRIAQLGAMLSHDAGIKPDDVKARFLTIVSENDRTVHPGAAAAFAEAANSPLLWLRSDWGHFAILDEIDIATEAVRNFLQN